MFVSVRAAVAGVLEKVVSGSKRSVHVTARYATWHRAGGSDPLMGGLDPLILESNDSTRILPASEVVERHVIEAAALVERLLERGIPEEVALGLLPHEVYVRLGLDKYDRKE